MGKLLGEATVLFSFLPLRKWGLTFSEKNLLPEVQIIISKTIYHILKGVCHAGKQTVMKVVPLCKNGKKTWKSTHTSYELS